MAEFLLENVHGDWNVLLDEFPEIFREPSPLVVDTLKERGIDYHKSIHCNLRYGFEMGIGWIQIVRWFCEDIDGFVCKYKSQGIDLEYKACIMKEKFGEFTPQGHIIIQDGVSKELRDEIMNGYWKIISRWADRSQKTCEFTGKPGQLVKRGYWVKTLCKEAAEEHHYEW